MIAYYQGRAVGEPDGPWRLTFALGRLENLSFFFSYKSYAEHPRFYGFWALGSLQFSLEHSFGTLWIGRQGLEAYSSWIWEDDFDRIKPKDIWRRFDNHVTPKVNHRLSRYQLHQIWQKSEETIDDFMMCCRNQAAKCNKTKESSKKPFKKRWNNIAWKTNWHCSNTRGYTLLQFEQLAGNWDKDVHGIKKSASNSNKYMQCPNSGLEHSWITRESCPARGSECLNCRKPTHWARVCRKP